MGVSRSRSFTPALPVRYPSGSACLAASGVLGTINSPSPTKRTGCDQRTAGRHSKRLHQGLVASSAAMRGTTARRSPSHLGRRELDPAFPKPTPAAALGAIPDVTVHFAIPAASSVFAR